MKLLTIIILATLISGCSRTIPSINMNVEQLTPYDVKGKKTSTISVSKMIDACGSKRPVGNFYVGLLCLPNGKLYWTPGSKLMAKLDDMLRIKLNNAGYSLLGKAYSPFNDEFSKQSDYLIGGKIFDVVWNDCYFMNGNKGEIYLNIEWEIYSNKTKNVILTLTTAGIYIASDFVGDNDLVERAFSMAADNLLADESFYKLLVTDMAESKK